MAENSSAYCRATAASMCCRGSPPSCAHSSRGHLPRLVEPAGRPQLDQPPGLLGAEQAGKDPLAVVGVVDEQQQVAEADQRVGAVAGRAQRIGPAMNVAYHVDPHPPTVGKSGRLA